MDSIYTTKAGCAVGQAKLGGFLSFNDEMEWQELIGGIGGI
jgi:hypothetical protein